MAAGSRARCCVRVGKVRRVGWRMSTVRSGSTDNAGAPGTSNVTGTSNSAPGALTEEAGHLSEPSGVTIEVRRASPGHRGATLEAERLTSRDSGGTASPPRETVSGQLAWISETAPGVSSPDAAAATLVSPTAASVETEPFMLPELSSPRPRRRRKNASMHTTSTRASKVPAAEEPRIRPSWLNGSPPDDAVSLTRAGDADTLGIISSCDGLGLPT